jgi:hypothetical protein
MIGSIINLIVHQLMLTLSIDCFLLYFIALNDRLYYRIYVDLIDLLDNAHLMLLFPLHYNFEAIVSFHRRAPQIKVFGGFRPEHWRLKLMLVDALSLSGLLAGSLVFLGPPFCFLFCGLLGFQFFQLAQIDGYLVEADVSEVFDHLEAFALLDF